MIHIISVEPLAEGWMLRQSDVENAQHFATGARAEDAAIRLGERLSDAGRAAEIRIYTRDGALAGRYVCA